MWRAIRYKHHDANKLALQAYIFTVQFYLQKEHDMRFR